MAYVETLSGADIKFGRKLWHSLRASKRFPTKGVLWVLKPEAGEWRLVIVTPRVDRVGTRDAYRELAEATRDIPEGDGHRFKIELMSPRNPLYQALRSVFAKTKSVEGARLGNTQVGGTYIDEAYLYEVR